MAFSSTPPEDATPDELPTSNDPTASVEDNGVQENAVKDNSTVKENADLLNAVLPPLLKDFQHWFSRTAQLLETQELTFLSSVEQADLLERVRVAAQQVSASQSLAAVTEGQTGIDMPVVMAWHQLVYECWGVALRYRKENAAERERATEPDNSSPNNSSPDNSSPSNSSNPPDAA